MKAPKPNSSRLGNSAGSSSKEQTDDIDDSGINEYKELSYKLFQLRDYKVRDPDGAFMCPFCACKEEGEYQYPLLLQHAIRVAEGSLSGKQRAKHFAMAKYLAFDLANEVKAEVDADQVSFTGRKRSRPGEGITKNYASNRGARTATRRQPKVDVNVEKAEKRAKEALDRVRELESELNSTKDQLNALITRDRLSNDELQGVRTELIEGLSEIGRDETSLSEIGVKKFGELDPEVFFSELRKRFYFGEVEVKGVELCTLWEGKIKDPHWYPFTITVDATGKFQRIVRDDDVSLQALKEEWGKGIYDEVVQALTDLQEHNPSGCYMVPELWNFLLGRKATPSEFQVLILFNDVPLIF